MSPFGFVKVLLGRLGSGLGTVWSVSLVSHPTCVSTAVSSLSSTGSTISLVTKRSFRFRPYLTPVPVSTIYDRGATSNFTIHFWFQQVSHESVFLTLSPRCKVGSEWTFLSKYCIFSSLISPCTFHYKISFK